MKKIKNEIFRRWQPDYKDIFCHERYTVIDILHAHGLCISYERILRVTQGLIEATLNLFEHEEAVIPGNLHTDLTLTCLPLEHKITEIKIQDVQFQNRTIMELVYQYFDILLLWTLEKRDIMRYMLRFHQQTVERWENYLSFTRNLKRSKIFLNCFFHQF